MKKINRAQSFESVPSSHEPMENLESKIDERLLTHKDQLFERM